MGRIVIWIVGLALISLIYVATLHFKVDEIETDLKDRSELALIKEDLPWAQVETDGRDVIITGSAPDQASILRAEDAVRSVWGVRQVKCLCKIAKSKRAEIPANEPLIRVNEPEPVSDTGAVSKTGNETPPAKIDQTQSSGDNIITLEQCQKKIETLLEKQSIVFKTGSSKISKKSLPLLDQLATTMKTCPDYQIEVAGHTDNVGETDKNILLSLDRAQAVMEHLQEKGISGHRLKAVGYGSSSPIAPNDTEEGRERNRRIEFHLTP